MGVAPGKEISSEVKGKTHVVGGSNRSRSGVGAGVTADLSRIRFVGSGRCRVRSGLDMGQPENGRGDLFF